MEGKRRGAHTWWVIGAGEGPRRRPSKGTDEDLGTWRRTAGGGPLAVGGGGPVGAGERGEGERKRAG